MENKHLKNLAACIHLSTFSRFIIPFGNFIGPLILWISNKEKSNFIDAHGKQAINFQISILLYSFIIGLLTVPFFLFQIIKEMDFINIHAFESISINLDKPSPLFYIGGTFAGLAVIAFILELVLIIKASLTAKDGELFTYPFTINFLK